MALQFRRGTAEQRETVSFTPLQGEPIYETDTNKLFIGDGTTPGGVDLFSSFQLTDCNDVNLTSDVLYSIASYAIASEVVTITTATIHPFAATEVIVIQNSPVTALNGTHTVTGTTSGTFTFTLTGAADITSTATSGFARKTIADGSTLIYDSTTSKWENQLIPTPSLVTLPDVNFTPALSDAYNYLPLVYDNANDEWINVPAFGLLSILNDVDEVTNPPAAGDVLIYNEDPGDPDIPWKWRPGTPRTNLSDSYDVDLSTPAADGDVLTYDFTASKWKALAPTGAGTSVQSTSFAFVTPATAPTTAVPNSQNLGRNFGNWYEVNSVNAATISQGPSAPAFDGNLIGIAFDPVAGVFSGFTQGRYRADATINLIIDNPTPGFYTSPNIIPVYLVYFGVVTSAFRLVDSMFGLLPYTSYGSTPASITISSSMEFVAEEVNPADSHVFISLDQDMSGAYYANNSSITFTRLGDI